MDMAKNEEQLSEINNLIKSKRIPILTLDTRWHELFPDYDKPDNIKALEHQLNELLKKQGKMVNEVKDMKKLKKKLMNEIVENMDTGYTPAGKTKAKKLMKSHELIQEINIKLKDSDDELGDIPYQIKKANERLMIESVAICYARLHKNKIEINKIAAWVKRAREELKNRILIKQDMEMKNTLIYSNMHDLLGAEIMEVFDKRQEEKEISKSEEQKKQELKE